MAKGLTWNGNQVLTKVTQNAAKAMGNFGLAAEGESKKELQKGHGVLTGTLRRSIHTAQPGYNWAGDNTPPSNSSPERGGMATDALIEDGKVTVQLGSGLGYALPVHQGHHGFEGYHFLTIGVQKAKVAHLKNILREFRLK